MLLSLHYSPTAQRPATAAFLAGAEPLAWLRELGSWDIAPENLACYVVPESVHSVWAAGLLVVPTGAARLPADCREPYDVVAGRLYLPTHATLRPAATDAELQSRLLYAVQFFHPTIGLVGFEATDQLDLTALVTAGPPRPADWSRAQPGPPLPPPLHQIRVEAPTLREVLDPNQAEVGTAPLTSVPGQPEPPTPLQQALNKLKDNALRAGLKATDGLLDGLKKMGEAGSGSAGQGPGQAAGTGGSGLLEQLNNFFKGSLDELERKRRNELERLLELFGQDIGEALRYAIPLDSPYQHRGTAAPGSQLGPRPTEFNLGGLGGGGRVDGWDIGPYESQLRAQYQRAAEQEAAAGRAKKAAYIYAHLLGNYLAAAQALEAGGFFREAAVLYQEHLRNPRAAALALERGGFWFEAIELYVGLSEWEKAGDLHQQLGQPDQARAYYERAAAEAEAKSQLLLAARLLSEKLARPTQAEALLLTGWAGPRQPADHLREYLRLLAARPAGLPAALRTLYQQHTPPGRHLLLLETLLAHLPTRPTDPALQAVVQELGFEIISQEAAAGRPNSLHLLKKLLPQDHLLAGDASRYITGWRGR
ncbi:MAG: hypothetical protein ACRYFX_23345 [Janthinobacterium lividum]